MLILFHYTPYNILISKCNCKTSNLVEFTSEGGVLRECTVSQYSIVSTSSCGGMHSMKHLCCALTKEIDLTGEALMVGLTSGCDAICLVVSLC